MSSECEGDVTFDLKIDNTEAVRSIQYVMSFLNGYARMLRLLGLPEGADAMLMKLQRVVSQVNMTIVSLLALQAASGPYGLLFAGFAATGTALTAGEVIYDAMRGV